MKAQILYNMCVSYLCMIFSYQWAIPLIVIRPILTTSFYLTPGTDDGEFSITLVLTFAAILPWYRWSVQPMYTLGQTLAALLPWYRQLGQL